MGSKNGGMLKLSMKKLGTPENEEALSVAGNGGVIAEGDTAFAPAGAAGEPETVGLACGGTTVRGWECCVRTSGATGGAGAVVVVGTVVVVVGAGVGLGFGVVPVVVGGGAGSDGVGSAGGAGTVVVPVVPVSAVAGSAVPTVALASAAPANVSASSATSSGESAVVRRRRVIAISCPAGS